MSDRRKARRKARFSDHLRAYMGRHTGARDPIGGRVETVLAHEELFDLVDTFAGNLLAEKDPELHAKLGLNEEVGDEGDDPAPDPTPAPAPAHPILQMLVQWFIANWPAILQFIMTLFVHAALENLETRTDLDTVRESLKPKAASVRMAAPQRVAKPSTPSATATTSPTTPSPARKPENMRDVAE